ncbi:MAG: hypothetical protein LBO66_12355 [Deltaproteobacteria bacterium]|jgi:predicted Fe-Mo cluster-binding NifX family protein|nr:hypothetical protein [Deltaproteobacteria bacterium]
MAKNTPPILGPKANSRLRASLFRPARVAVASLTGENIDLCFGRAEEFRVYALNLQESPPSYALMEIRHAPRPCRDQKHDQALLKETAELLKDCPLVLAGRLGPGALSELARVGILGLSAPLSVNEALKRLAAG